MMHEVIGEVFTPSYKPKQFRKVYGIKVNNIWSMDLVFMNEASMVLENDGYKYILFCIDVYSRFAFARKLKTKNATEVLEAFKSIIEEAGNYPEKIYVDQGSEFYNKKISEYLKKNNIDIYSTYGENKASIIERFNRTIKNMMYKQLLINRSWRWIDILQHFINIYNHKKHKGIKNLAPHSIYVLGRTYVEMSNAVNHKDRKFKVGDLVRIPYIKGNFDKGYFPKWTYEVFKISKALITRPYTYNIVDLLGEEIKGSFYESELLKSTVKEGTKLVEEIIDERFDKSGVKTHYLVKWLGLDKKFNTWERVSEIEALLK